MFDEPEVDPHRPSSLFHHLAAREHVATSIEGAVLPEDSVYRPHLPNGTVRQALLLLHSDVYRQNKAWSLTKEADPDPSRVQGPWMSYSLQ